MNNTNTEKKNGRHVEWFVTTVFAIVALVALLKDFEGDLKDQGKPTKWAVSGIVIAFILSLSSVVGHMAMKEQFIGTIVEGGMAIVTCGFWAAVLPAIMDPDNNLAVTDNSGGIRNANLYFFTWGGFVMSFMTLAGFAKEQRGSSDVMSMSTVGAMSMTSFITMIAAVRLWKSNECGSKDEFDELLGFMAPFMKEACNRTSFAISLGLISSILSVIWIVTMMHVSGLMGIYFEAFSGLLMLALWCFGVGYITFGGLSAPARDVGNLYFFTWGSFALAVVLFMRGFKNFMDRNNGTVENQQVAGTSRVADAEKQQYPDQEGVATETEA